MGESGGIARGDAKEYDLAPGTMVGEYRVEGELGAGGMGKVYSAMHPVIAKRAAIKVLHLELSVNTEAVERFVQEARSVNQIGHPNIVDIFAFGTLPDGRSYFVMEWLRGQSLRAHLDRGIPPIAETLQILDSIAVALGAAHETGIVHRDLKPDNVFLVDIKGAAPQVKLLDFGIAKLLGQDAVRAERTRTGNLMGTPAYISPEQARGYAVDHRTDVYALGALAYEMLTDWLPFPADNAADMIAKHLFEPPPQASLKNPDVTPELDALIIQMMAKEADARPSLDEVRQRLRQFFNRFLVTGPTGANTPALRRDQTPAPAHHTPPPGTQTGVGAVSAYQTSPGEPAPRSKAGLFAIVGLLAGALGIGVFFLARGSGDSAKDTAGESRPTESSAPGSGDVRATEPKAIDSRSNDSKAADSQGTAPTGADPKATDSQGTAPTGADPKVTDSQGTAPTGADPKATDSQGTAPTGADPKATDSKATDSKARDTKAADSTATDSKAAESKVTDSKTTDSKATGPKAADAKATDTKGNKATKKRVKTKVKTPTVVEDPDAPM